LNSSSEFIAFPSQFGDTVAYFCGYGCGEFGDVVWSGCRVEDDGREAEASLQRAALGVDVLDAGKGDQGAVDPDYPPLKVDFLGPDLVPPPPPA